MRSNTLIRGVVFSVALAVALSCAPKKRLASAGSDERRVSRTERLNVLDYVAERQLNYATFSGRAKARMTINKERYDVTANIRMISGEAIWISVTAFMGIEAGRVLITPDSVKVMNRLQAEYVKKPFDYLHNFMSSELDFSSLQQLLLGNVINNMDGGGTEVWKGDTGYLLQRQTEDLRYSVRLDTIYRNVHTSMDEAVRRQQLEAFYADYRGAVGFAFPHHVEILITAPALNLRSEMDYSRVVYDETVEMPFHVPTRYKEI